MKITLRPANQKDIMQIFNLANDTLVRQYSFKTKIIKLTDHKKWFLEKLKDKNSLILIAEKDNQFVGQVRFDFGDENIIGVSICPMFRGKGIGSKLIIEGIEFVQNIRPSIENIIAYIKIENTASIKSFEEAGFSFDNKLIIDNQQALRYVYISGETNA